MSKKLLLAIATAAGFAAGATTAMAAPLPAGTILKFAKTTDAAGITPCANGSCFGMFLTGPLYFWTPLGAGTDTGIVLGKPQLSGGQEVTPTSTADGQLSAMWVYGGNSGTFFSAPDSAANIFDSASCAGAACIGKTELKTLNVAWGGKIIPMGSSTGCNVTLFSNCTVDQQNGIFIKNWTVTPVAGSTTLEGAAFTLEYNQVVKAEFPNFPFSLILKGTISLGVPPNAPPVVTATNVSGYDDVALPYTVTVTDPDGPLPATCRLGTLPANGTAILNGCTGGTYTARIGFVGTDSFTIIANDSVVDSILPATVNAAIIPMPASPTPTYTPTNTAMNTPTNTAVNTPTNTAVNTPTNTAVNTPTNTAVNTPTNTPSNTVPVGVTPSPTATNTPSNTAKNTPTNTAVNTPTNTAVNTPTFTAVNTPTNTAVTVPSPTPIITACTDQYPLSQVTVTGKRGNVTVVLSGNIISSSSKTIKICPGTPLTYSATTNKPGASVKCQVKHNRTTGTGTMKVNDELKCTDKPVGNDKVEIKARSGINKPHD